MVLKRHRPEECSRSLALICAALVLTGCTSSGHTGTGAPSGNASTHPASSHPASSHPSDRPSSQPGTPHPRGVPAADMPNLTLTPGIALHVGAAQVCVPGYATSARDVSDSDKTRVYARYHVTWVPYQHEVDHLISLELGGSNRIGNLWPEPYAGRWGARTKDALENRLHALVCAGELSLASAQRQEATNWVAAYRRYIGEPPSGSGSGSGIGAGAGGYYASSYPSASTIYCADDPAWRELSEAYLEHFKTFAQALGRFPSYHLHQPC